MDKREIGKSGLKVFPIGLGAMPLSIQGRPREEQAARVVEVALELGIDFIDTANVYCLDDSDIGHNEQMIAKVLRAKSSGAAPRLHDVVVATKGGLTRPHGEWHVDASPGWLRKSCEQSLRNLGVDAISLYQLHAPDDNVPFEDSVGELARLKEEGKIRHVGLSNVVLEELNSAQKIVRIESVQNRCHPFQKKDFKNGLIDACRQQGVTYIPYSPFGGGYSHRRMTEQALFADLARRYDVSPYRIILGWLLTKGPHILPIPGASKVGSIQDSCKAVTLGLSPDDVAHIDKLPDEPRF